jgi:hypothetical protein
MNQPIGFQLIAYSLLLAVPFEADAASPKKYG